MKWLAPAKINLSLRILGRRDDGFHEIETLMAPLTLADEIMVEPAGHDARPIELACTDPTLPTDAGNLAYRAAELLRARLERPALPVRLTLIKHVPHGAGLGGGSSDAACVLLALNEFWAAGFDTVQLAAMAAELGSDVPFFVFRSPAICRGRGEQVQPVSLDKPLPLLLLKPPFPVPTPLAYQRWQASRELPGVRYSAQDSPSVQLYNDLERPVFEKYVVLADIKNWLLAQPEVSGALMSGSGSTMFAVLRDGDVDGDALSEHARHEFGPLWTCPCSTSSPGGLRTDVHGTPSDLVA